MNLDYGFKEAASDPREIRETQNKINQMRRINLIFVFYMHSSVTQKAPEPRQASKQCINYE